MCGASKFNKPFAKHYSVCSPFRVASVWERRAPVKLTFILKKISIKQQISRQADANTSLCGSTLQPHNTSSGQTTSSQQPAATDVRRSHLFPSQRYKSIWQWKTMPASDARLLWWVDVRANAMCCYVMANFYRDSIFFLGYCCWLSCRLYFDRAATVHKNGY